MRKKAHMVPHRDSLNLSDLSDEEVDRRLTQRLSQVSIRKERLANEESARNSQISRNSTTSGAPIHREHEGLIIPKGFYLV
jgi:hypothetical protein